MSPLFLSAYYGTEPAQKVVSIEIEMFVILETSDYILTTKDFLSEESPLKYFSSPSGNNWN